MNLSNVTSQELKEELERRELAITQTKTIPEQLTFIDWSMVVELCNSAIARIANEGDRDEDTPYYIYEVAMEAVFGPNVFDWINERCRPK